MVTFTADTYTLFDRRMVLLQLCCWKFSYKETVADFIRLNLNILFTKTTNSLSEPLLGELQVTYALNLYLVENHMVNFLFTIIDYFSLALMVEVTLSANFRWKGTSPTTMRCYQRTRMIVVSCSIKISAIHSFIFSQSTHVTDKRSKL